MTISLNAPCPCGSGKIFKLCCGKSQASPPAFAVDIPVLLRQAFAHHQQGRLPQAEAGYRQILALQPDNPDALHLLGQLAENTGRAEMARDMIARAVQKNPREALYRVSMARIMQTLNPGEAELHARKALQLQPGLHEARYFLANALKRQSRLEEAAVEYQRVLVAQSQHPGALNNLGSTLNDLHRHGEALVCLKKLLSLQPNAFDALYNAAMVLRNMGHFEESLVYHEQALSLRPSGDMRFGVGVCALALGRLDRGWLEYEARFLKEVDAVPVRPFSQARWQGQSLSGKRLLIWGEQGIGDEILFAAEIGDAIAAGASVLMECEPRLKSLFARSFPQAEVHARSKPPAPALLRPDIDFQIPSGSLARAFRPQLADFPLRRSYLVPDPQQTAHWRNWLAGLPAGPKIGIAWRSMKRGVERDHYYSDLLQWSSILGLPDVVFVNLQYGECREELAAAERQFGVSIHQAPGLNLKDDLDGAAALTQALDAAIAPNTSVFAMAGAVGTPAWLLNLDSDWTMLGTEGIPWLPSVKVCRKSWEEPWEKPLQEVADDLKAGRLPSLRQLPAQRKEMPALPADAIPTLLANGYRHFQAGQAVLAEFHFWRVLATQDDNPDALNLLGLTYLQTGRFDVAVSLLTRAIAARPEQPAYRNNLGNALRAMGREDEARSCYEQAIQLDPAYARAHNNLGIVLKKQGQAEAAETHFLRAIELEPQAADYHANLGNALLDQGRPDAAIPVLEKALELHPDLPEALSSMGTALYFMPGGLPRALACHERAVSLMPEYFMARWRMSSALLASGDLARGWQEYAWRFKAREGFRCAYPQRPWAGEALAGKRVLIWGEQGVGDEILFAGMFPEIRSAGATLSIVCEPRLRALFARSFPYAKVLPQSFPLGPALLDPGIDYQFPAGDIARWYHPTAESFSPQQGYLVPAPERVAHWKDWLANLGPGLKVGISWRSMARGNFRNSYYSDLPRWGEILRTPGVVFVNLQYGECGEELAEAERLFGVRIHEAPGLNLKDDLDEAAALTRAMDLAIAPNTSVFAMAGAVGTPTWMLNLDCDWTMLGTDHMPWFPGVEVFRKHWGTPWEPVLSEVARRLSQQAGTETS